MLNSFKKIPSKKAEYAANGLLSKHLITDPADIDLEGILALEGGYLFYKPLTGAQGRIVLKNESAIITVNSNVQESSRRRYILSHEIGHFSMHRNLPQRTYNCYEKDMVDWSRKQAVETEANEFAASLLMPSKCFKAFTKGQGLSYGIMQELQDTFGTSFTSTAIRYTQIGDVPSAIISMSNGFVEFAKFSSDFPGQFVPNRTRIPNNTVAFDVLNGDTPSKKPTSVYLRDWFQSGLEDKYYDRRVNELCICSQRYKLILSLLWTL
jgi:Zn-dependent peptidase ImmA (M78 family)